MSKVLYLKGSPRDRSHSTAVAEAFIDSYKQKNPDDEIKVLNVFEKKLPAFDGFIINAKYNIMHGNDHSDAEKNAWKEVEEIIEEFKSADKYIISTGMWNFGIPYRLKQYIDIITQPGYTFSFSPEEGYSGLITGKPIFISYARGGEYPPGTDAENMDFQKRYLDFLLGFIGFTDIKSVVIEPTLTDQAQKKREEAIEKAKEIAKSF